MKCFVFRNKQTGTFKYVVGPDNQTPVRDRGLYMFLGKFSNMSAAQNAMSARFPEHFAQDKMEVDSEDARLVELFGVI